MMNDRAPVVNFNTPPNRLSELHTQRMRLAGVVADIEASIKDVRGYAAQGQRDAGYAVAWAATLMVTDILRISLSASDKRAKLLFNAQDKALSRANQVLVAAGGRAMPTKSDLMKGVDTSLSGAAQMTKIIRDAQKFLKDAGVKVSKDTTLLVDLGTAMCDDTVLMLSAGLTSQNISNNAAHTQAVMWQHLQKVRRSLLIINSEFTRAFEEQERWSRTA